MALLLWQLFVGGAGVFENPDPEVEVRTKRSESSCRTWILIQKETTFLCWSQAGASYLRQGGYTLPSSGDLVVLLPAVPPQRSWFIWNSERCKKNNKKNILWDEFCGNILLETEEYFVYLYMYFITCTCTVWCNTPGKYRRYSRSVEISSSVKNKHS